MRKLRSLRYAAATAVFVLLVFGVAVDPVSSATNLPDNWVTDWDAAAKQAKQSGKGILAVFSAEWCGPCQTMIRDIYPKPEVKGLLEREWVAVYIDIDKQPQRGQDNRIDAYPTFVIFSSDAKEEDRFVGARSQEDFVKVLKNHKSSMQRLTDVKAKLEQTPEDPAIWKQLAELHEERDKREEAFLAYEKAAFYDPKDKTEVADDVYFYKAVTRLEGDFEGLKKELDPFEQKFPKSRRLAEVWLYRGWALANMGETESAVTHLNEGIQKFAGSQHVETMKGLLEQLQ